MDSKTWLKVKYTVFIPKETPLTLKYREKEQVRVALGGNII